MDLNMSDIKQEVKLEQGIENDSTDCSEMSHSGSLRNYYMQSKERKANKAAERSRLYRQRHRDRINEQRRINRQIKLNERRTKQIAETKLNEKQGHYCERFSEEVDMDIKDERQNQTDIQLDPTTSAECNHKYNEQHRKEINKREIYSRHLMPSDVECIINTSDDDVIQNIQRFNSSDDTQSVSLKERLAEKAAERSRLYRQRHGDKINERRRRNRQKKLLEKQKMESVDEISEPKSNRKSNLRLGRQRCYYERHREEINKNKRERRQKRNPLVPSTNAERNRKYRERNRKEINERRKYSRQFQKHFMPIDVECIISTTNSSDDEVIQKIPHCNSSQHQHSTHFE